MAEEARFPGVGLSELLTDLRSAGMPSAGMDPARRLDHEICRLDFPSRPGSI